MTEWHKWCRTLLKARKEWNKRNVPDRCPVRSASLLTWPVSADLICEILDALNKWYVKDQWEIAP